MGLDFKLIEDVSVGYRLKYSCDNNIATKLEPLEFKIFIIPYKSISKTYKQIYDVTEKALTDAIEQQNSEISHGKSESEYDSLGAALKRESMMNAMHLIEKWYLK